MSYKAKHKKKLFQLQYTKYEEVFNLSSKLSTVCLFYFLLFTMKKSFIFIFISEKIFHSFFLFILFSLHSRTSWWKGSCKQLELECTYIFIYITLHTRKYNFPVKCERDDEDERTSRKLVKISILILLWSGWSLYISGELLPYSMLTVHIDKEICEKKFSFSFVHFNIIALKTHCEENVEFDSILKLKKEKKCMQVSNKILIWFNTTNKIYFHYFILLSRKKNVKKLLAGIKYTRLVCHVVIHKIIMNQIWKSVNNGKSFLINWTYYINSYWNLSQKLNSFIF